MADLCSAPAPLSPQQRSKIRRLSQPAETEAGAGGELNVTPYLDILMNVMIFVLATVSVTFVTTIDTRAAAANQVRRDRSEGITALITASGVALQTTDGSLAPGCASRGPGIAVPNRHDGSVDIEGLTRCARTLRASLPDVRQVVLTSSPDVDYATVIAVMDGLRGPSGERLFDDIVLGVAR